MAECSRAKVEIPDRRSSAGHKFTILVLCDGEESKRRASDHLRRVTEAGMDDFVVEVHVRTLPVSAQSATANVFDELAAADLLILAIGHLGGFNETMRNRLGAIFQQMRSGCAAVALLPMDNDLTSRGALDFLHAAAKRAGIDFIFPVTTQSVGTRPGDYVLPEDVHLQPVD